MRRASILLLALVLAACGSIRTSYVPDGAGLSRADRDAYQDAIALAAAGRRDRAIAALERLAARVPDHVPTRLRLQDLEIERDGEEAVRARLDPSGERWIDRLLRARLQADAAIRLRLYLALRDERPGEVWAQLAVADAAAAVFRATEEASEEAARRGNVEDRERMEELAAERERALEDAAEAVETALSLDPLHVPALRRRGDVLGLRAGREPSAERRRRLLEERLAAYDAALALAPDDIPTLVARAAVERARNDYVAAQRDLFQAIRLRPWDPDLHQNLGVVAYESGQLALAERSFRKALSLEPRSAETLRNLGDALAVRERLDEAREMYQRALRFSPDAPPLLERLGNLELRAGDPVRAREWYRRYLEVGGADRARVEAALRRAESGGSS